MGFGAEMEMKIYLGEDDGEVKEDEDGPGESRLVPYDVVVTHFSGFLKLLIYIPTNVNEGAIAVESLLNIRTVASLSLESIRLNDYTEALIKKNPQSLITTFKKCSLVASGQFIQMWGCALMFW